MFQRVTAYLVPAALIAVPGTLVPEVAHAYIGPGLGAGTIAVVLGVVAAVFMAFIGLLWYPLKRLVRRRRKETDETRQP